MKNVIVITILILSNLAFGQVSIADSKSFDELSSEELYQLGVLTAIESYNNKVNNSVLGFFFGTIAIDLTASIEIDSQAKYQKWIKNLNLSNDIKENRWFIRGFITKRKEQKINSMRKGRIIFAAASVAAISILLPDIVELD